MRNAESGAILADPGEYQATLNEETDLMIERVTIKDFRCFLGVEADDLGRVNVVVGDNGAGKTAFLEALFLVAGNSAENHAKLKAWRDFRPLIQMVSQELADGSFHRDAFRGFSFENSPQIAIHGSENRRLRIEHTGREGIHSPDGRDATSPVDFVWLVDDEELRSQPRLVNGAVDWGVKGQVRTKGTWVGYPIVPPDVVGWFANLKEAKSEQEFLRVLRQSFPEIKDVSVGLSSTKDPTLFVDLGGEVGRLMPLSFVSAGIYRLFRLLLATSEFAGGLVLIDEIETGIYYNRLEDMWRALDGFSARGHPTQVFASTHSLEALQALEPIAAENPNDYRLIRVSRQELEVFEGEEMVAALQGRMEIR